MKKDPRPKVKCPICKRAIRVDGDVFVYHSAGARGYAAVAGLDCSCKNSGKKIPQ